MRSKRVSIGLSLGVLLTATLLLLATMLAGQASAQEDPYGGGKPNTNPDVLGTTEDTGADVGGSGESVLPFTGADLTIFMVVAAGAIGTGVVLVRRNRSRAQES